MPTSVEAVALLARHCPTDAGERLAKVILRGHEPLRDLEIDLRGAQPSMVISGFFSAFLQCVYDHAPDVLDDAREIRWMLDFGFQRENAARWTKAFKPREPAKADRDRVP